MDYRHENLKLCQGKTVLTRKRQDLNTRGAEDLRDILNLNTRWQWLASRFDSFTHGEKEASIPIG